MKEIWYVRHGETEWNAQRRFQGHLDIPLSPVGIGQAFRLAERLSRSRISFDRLYASDLRRARQTAEPLAQVLGLPIATTPLLREIHVGELAGLTRAEAEARFPSFLAEAAEDPWNARRPGGRAWPTWPEGFRPFWKRCRPAATSWSPTAASSAPPSSSP